MATENAQFRYVRLFIDQKIEDATYERGEIRVTINKKEDTINSNAIEATAAGAGSIAGAAARAAATL